MAHDTLDHAQTADALTKNERLVYEALKEAGVPQKAYDLLDRLKDKGVRAPMTIYRALEGLEEKGLVHKLDALNAFVLCNHDAPHQIQSFLVCEACEEVIEIDNHLSEAPAVETNIQKVSEAMGFHMASARLEVRGTCKKCHL
ncbi:MAG: Fur family transcriptional regulator [bacterium]